MTKNIPAGERARAERLAHLLDQGLQQHPPYTEPASNAKTEDAALLRLAEHLATQSAFAPTPTERAGLRSRFEQIKDSQKFPAWRNPIQNMLQPTLQAVVWTVLLIGLFSLTAILISNLLGKPTTTPAGPAPTRIATQPAPTATPAPRPVSLTLEQALTLVQNPTWNTVFFEFQYSWHGANGKDYSFYKQAWMDRQKQGRVISSDQVEGTAPRSPEIKPNLLFISDGERLKAIRLPSGDIEAGFDNAPWKVSPLENAGQAMADIFPSLSGIDQAGTLTLEPFEEEIAGRPAFVIRGTNVRYWYDLEKGLLLRKEQTGETPSNLQVLSVAYEVAVPAAFDDTKALAQITFTDTLPPLQSGETAPAQAFPVQSQTVDGIRMELRELATLGSSLRATVCYQLLNENPQRLEGVELIAGGRALDFYPSSSDQPTLRTDGLACETFTAAHPGLAHRGVWTVTVKRMVGPRSGTPDCAIINQQFAKDYPGLSVNCNTGGTGFGYTIDKVPEGMSHAEMRRIVSTYMETEVRSGPWTFSVPAGDIISLIGAGGPPAPVIVPSACDEHSRLIVDTGMTDWVNGNYAPVGLLGGGALQSGKFTFMLALACDPNFSRLKTYGEERSEINGLGVLWVVTYQGEPTGDGVYTYSGLAPFVMHGGGGGSIDRNSAMSGYEGLLVPYNVLPDFSQSDTHLRYLLKSRTPDGTIEGAALTFTLQRAPEGYRPVDVQVEPLTEAERQTVEADPAAPLPFPTLPAPVTSQTAENQALIDLLDQWQEPLLASPGWVHTRTRTEMSRGNDLYAGIKEYTSDDWYKIDETGLVVAFIHIDRTLNGAVMQQAYSQDGKTVINLTFGQGGGPSANIQPYTLDLAYAPRSALKSSEPPKRVDTIIDGKPVILLVTQGSITRREAVDAASGAPLYSESVYLQPGDDLAAAGSLESRATLETAERVDAPPAEALVLFGKEFTGFTPPAPSGTPAPLGYDPSQSKVSMRTVNGDNFPGSSFWYGDLYADGYLLGRVDFGGVPGGWCSRSVDGSRIAFNYAVNNPASSTSESTLRILDLRDLQHIAAPAPELLLSSFTTWSPTGNQVAFFACKAGKKDCGLYLYDVDMRQIRLVFGGVISAQEALFKPDGSQIAFFGMHNEQVSFIVVESSTGKVIFQSAVDQQNPQVPANAPVNTWEVTMPKERKSCFETR